MTIFRVAGLSWRQKKRFLFRFGTRKSLTWDMFRVCSMPDKTAEIQSRLSYDTVVTVLRFVCERVLYMLSDNTTSVSGEVGSCVALLQRKRRGESNTEEAAKNRETALGEGGGEGGAEAEAGVRLKAVAEVRLEEGAHFRVEAEVAAEAQGELGQSEQRAKRRDTGGAQSKRKRKSKSAVIWIAHHTVKLANIEGLTVPQLDFAKLPAAGLAREEGGGEGAVV